jgi:hypothetical protein
MLELMGSKKQLQQNYGDSKWDCRNTNLLFFGITCPVFTPWIEGIYFSSILALNIKRLCNFLLLYRQRPGSTCGEILQMGAGNSQVYTKTGRIMASSLRSKCGLRPGRSPAGFIRDPYEKCL